MDTSADRLRRARKAKGYTSASDAARALGIPVQTFISHENGSRGFGPEEASRYARAFGVSASYLLLLADGSSPPTPTVGIPVRTEAALGVWREAGADSMSQVEKISIPQSVDWRAADEYAVQIRDRSVDRLILPNEYAMCRPLRPGPVDLDQFQVNDFLHIERTKRGLKEISIRRVRAKDGRLHLSTYSSDPKIKNDVVYPSAGSEHIIICGVVVGKHVRFGHNT